MRKCKNQESFMDKKEPSHYKSATAVISTKYKNKPEFITLVIYRLLLLEYQPSMAQSVLLAVVLCSARNG